ncbi:uncharacterized protein LOC121188032 isoform X2 [Toxotes jaculatrix]|uniref:uncharacterized protein LOC121188032 isoform X2 n=1 Tax=Toxotes jaculatrix TaxID=941984 RepID=UPI001B3B0D73|nr:uncharacterized protein LOC121188032 isoform X2 [Toxotes jaculatrix]
MMRVLLLCACVCMGFSYNRHYEREYGNSHNILMLSTAHSIKFIPQHSSNGMILWSLDNPSVSDDGRRKVKGIYYVINSLTQRDSGRYIVSDKNQRVLSTQTIEVIAKSQHFAKRAGGQLMFTFNLEPNSCNIYFLPENDRTYTKSKTQIVRKGRLQHNFDEFECGEFDLLMPCGIVNQNLRASCSGRFEVRDRNDDMALEVLLEVEPQEDSSLYAIGFGAFLAVTFCCTCVRLCCCGKSSSGKDSSETSAAEEPAVPCPKYSHRVSVSSKLQYDHEPVPVAPRLEQPSEPSWTHPPAQPSYSPTAPLIHNPPTVNVPCTYPEVSDAAEQADAPTVPLCSDPEPRFEVKGMTFPPTFPLSSDSTSCDVYTSDKLTSF